MILSDEPRDQNITSVLEEHFRAGEPDWIQEASDVVNEHRVCEKREPIDLTVNARADLKEIIIKYLRVRTDWDGYLSKRQATALSSVAKKAIALRAALKKADDTGAGWYFRNEFAEQFVDADAVLNGLDVILETFSNTEIRTPQIPSHPYPVEEWASPSERETRGELQLELDNWWETHAGLPKDISDDEYTLYKQFLENIFGRMKLQRPPGASHSAVTDARKRYHEHQDKKREHDRAHDKERRDRLQILGDFIAQSPVMASASSTGDEDNASE